MLDAVGFAFIVLLPLIVVAGALVTLFLVGALFDALDYPEQLKTRIERPSTGRRSPRAARPATTTSRYWQGR